MLREHWNAHAHRLAERIFGLTTPLVLVLFQFTVYSAHTMCLKRVNSPGNGKYGHLFGLWPKIIWSDDLIWSDLDESFDRKVFDQKHWATPNKFRCTIQKKRCDLLTSGVLHGFNFFSFAVLIFVWGQKQGMLFPDN